MSSSSHHPQPYFGFWTSTSLVIGNMIGTGIFFLPAALAVIGPISMLGWIVTAFGAMSLAFVFARLSLVFPKSGGPYTHSRDAFGNLTGFMMGWGYWIMAWTSNAAVSIAFMSYMSLFFPSLAANTFYSFMGAIGVLWVATLVNCIGIKTSGRVQLITTLLKLAPLFIVPTVGFFFMDTQNFTPLNHTEASPFGAISSAFALTLWAFIGLESATVPADSVENPGKTIARATMTGTGIVALAYILTTFVLFGLMPADQLAASKAPFVDAATSIFGPWIAPLIGSCILISIYGGLNGWILVQGHIPLAMANEGLFPKCFTREAADGTPIFGTLVTSIIATVIILLNLDNSLAEAVKMVVEVGSVMTIIAYLLSSLSVYVLFRKSTDIHSRLTPALHVAIWGSALYALFSIYGADIRTIKYVLLGYAIGLPVYLWARWDYKATSSTSR